MNYDPDQVVCLNVTDPVSHIITADGESHLVHDDAAGRFVNVRAKFAHQMLCNLPGGLSLRKANHELAAAFGPYRPAPGISLRYLEAAMRPPSRVEIVERALEDWNKVRRF